MKGSKQQIGQPDILDLLSGQDIDGVSKNEPVTPFPASGGEHRADRKPKGGLRSLGTYPWWKGVFDRLLALFLIIVLSPLMLAMALVIRLDSPGKAIFPQERIGKDGRRFTLYKYRSMFLNHDDTDYREFLKKYMQEDASRLDENGQDYYQRMDRSRVTRFGAFLRKTNLDELPQVFNILKGEMSFIGPRPDIPFTVAMYQENHRRRFAVTPGITGLWQVSQRKNLSFEDMVSLDLDYINRQSPLLDLKILLMTARTILTGDGS